MASTSTGNLFTFPAATSSAPGFAWETLAEIRVDGRPKGQPRARSAKNMVGVYDPGTAKGWKSCITLAVAPHRPQTPLAEPVRVDVDVYFPRPKSWSPAVLAIYGGSSTDVPSGAVLFVSKPDRDNLDKAILDAFVDCGYLQDDRYVVDGRIRKFYAPLGGRPGARLRVMVWRARATW